MYEITTDLPLVLGKSKADTISIGRSASAESTKGLAMGYVADAEGANEWPLEQIH